MIGTISLELIIVVLCSMCLYVRMVVSTEISGQAME